MLGNGIKIAKLFGISVKLHYSWFIIFILVAWSLSASYFPATNPEWELATSIIVGIITSFLFFMSVLAHELMHSIVARSLGIPIEGITLFVFGGVSQMTDEPTRPQDEFRMAIAGPVTSLVLGGIFLSIRYLLNGLPDYITAVAFWLGWINVILAAFNLIPGFPLDGGRVLRSLLWWKNQNLKRATRIASAIGRVIGYLFIFAGIWILFQGNWFNGLWLAFIGWFLSSAAAGSYKQLELQELLKRHKVSEVMTTDCPTISPDITIAQLVHDNILTSGKRCFPIIDHGTILGIVTMSDIKTIPRDQWIVRTAKEAMTPFNKLKTISPNDDLAKAMQLLAKENINQVPVVKNDSIIGMLARDNLFSFINIRGELGV